MIDERTAVTAKTGDAHDTPRDEAFRLLRSTVKFATGERPLRTVLVVDVDRPDASDVARRLADSFARAGDRCAYVETDGRAADPGAGFSELIGGAPIETIATGDGTPAAALVPAGQGATADVLSSDGVADALARLTEHYAFVVLSCAPLPQFADALALAPRVDAVIMVASAGRTRRPKAVDARDALQRVGANILGVVLSEQPRRFFR